MSRSVDIALSYSTELNNVQQSSQQFKHSFQQYSNNSNLYFWLKAAPIGAANEKLPSKLHQHSKVYKGYAP